MHFNYQISQSHGYIDVRCLLLFIDFGFNRRACKYAEIFLLVHLEFIVGYASVLHKRFSITMGNATTFDTRQHYKSLLVFVKFFFMLNRISDKTLFVRYLSPHYLIFFYVKRPY